MEFVEMRSLKHEVHSTGGGLRHGFTHLFCNEIVLSCPSVQSNLESRTDGRCRNCGMMRHSGMQKMYKSCM